MKIIFSAIIFLLAYASAAVSQTAPTFCTGSDIDMQPSSESCLTTCKAVASRSASYLSSGNSGFCIGQATKSIFTLYELRLGQSSSGTDALCTIWTGTMQVSMKDNAPGAKATGGVIDLTKCANGSYDTLHIIMSRFTEFAGNTVFPDATGTGSSPAMVRTTQHSATQPTLVSTTPYQIGWKHPRATLTTQRNMSGQQLAGTPFTRNWLAHRLRRTSRVLVTFRCFTMN